MSNTAQTAANTMTATSAITGVASAAMSVTKWIETNYLLITLCLTFTSIIIALIFHLVSWRINLREVKRKEMEMEFDKKVKIANLRGNLAEKGMGHDEIEQFMKDMEL